jgi:hypothetical protein
MERLKRERNDALEEVNMLKVTRSLAYLHFLLKTKKENNPVLDSEVFRLSFIFNERMLISNRVKVFL